jgi:acyl carrier protein
VVKQVGALPSDLDRLADSADLYAAGLTSQATISVMLGLEEAFAVEFPDRLLRRPTFTTVDAMAAALIEIGVPTDGA